MGEPATPAEAPSPGEGAPPPAGTPTPATPTPTPAADAGGVPTPGPAVGPGEKTPEPKPSGETPPGAPEKYEAFTTPEGVDLDPKLIETATEAFREAGLPQGQAQKFVDLHSKVLGDYQQAQAQTVEAWSKELRDDAGFGQKFDENLTAVRGLVEKVAGADAQEILAIGHFPPLMKMLLTIANATSEDTWGGSRMPGGQPGPGASPAEKMAGIYTDMTKK